MIGEHTDVCSYLSDKFQVAAISLYRSDFTLIATGVPQGSHLGPLLFYVNINGITTYLFHCNLVMYSNGIKVFHTMASVSDTTFRKNVIKIAIHYNNNCIFLRIKSVIPSL